MASGKVRTYDDDVLVERPWARGGAEALLGPSDEADEGGFSADSTGQKAKGLFFGRTAKTADPLRAAGHAGGEAQAEHPKAVAAEGARGEANVSDEGTL